MDVELAGHLGVADRYDVVAVPRRPDDRRFSPNDPTDLLTGLVCGAIVLVFHVAGVTALTLTLVGVVVVVSDVVAAHRQSSDLPTGPEWDPTDPYQVENVIAVPAGKGHAVRREELESIESDRPGWIRTVVLLVVFLAGTWHVVGFELAIGMAAVVGLAGAFRWRFPDSTQRDPAPKVIATGVAWREAKALGAGTGSDSPENGIVNLRPEGA